MVFTAGGDASRNSLIERLLISCKLLTEASTRAEVHLCELQRPWRVRKGLRRGWGPRCCP